MHRKDGEIMFRKNKIKRDEQIIELIKENLEFEMEAANEALDFYGETHKDIFLQDYLTHKGRFAMCQTLLTEIEEL